MTAHRARAALLTLILAAGSAAPLRAAGPVEARVAPSWGAAVSEAAVAVQAQPSLAGASTALGATLGRLRLELALSPGSPAALSFVSRLPGAAAGPKAFAALPQEQRLRALDAAISAESAELDARASALLKRSFEGDLTAAEGAELDGLAARWFYLSPAAAAAVKRATSRQREERALGLAARVAARLSGRRVETPDAVVHAELSHAFAGAERLAAADTPRPGEGLVRNRLAPYMTRALDQAESRAVERGVSPGRVYASVIENHTRVFGVLADRGLFKRLRARGEWTELVSATSLHAAAKLNALVQPPRQMLAKAAETDDLRLAIPEWHPLFGKYASIAHWLAEVHGKPDDDSKGLLLLRARGIPVRADRTMPLALGLGAMQLGGLFAAASGHHLAAGMTLLMGLAATVLLYVSVLAHEFGHSTAASWFGIRTRHIVINIMGGGAAVVRGFRQALPEFVVALAGPVVSALCGVALIAAARLFVGTLAAPVLLLAGKLNLILALFNMFPLFPMDGARVVRAGLTRFLGSYRATKLTAALSMILSALLAYDGMTLFLAHQPGGLFRLFFGLFFAFVSGQMGVHPGTVTVDERPQRRR